MLLDYMLVIIYMDISKFPVTVILYFQGTKDLMLNEISSNVIRLCMLKCKLRSNKYWISIDTDRFDIISVADYHTRKHWTASVPNLLLLMLLEHGWAIPVYGGWYNGVHFGNHPKLLHTPLQDQRVGHVGVKHDSVRSHQQSACHLLILSQQSNSGM